MDGIVADALPRSQTVSADWIRAYAEREAELLRQISDVTSERDQYRELVSVSLAEVHALIGQLERLRESTRRLVAESREARQLGRRQRAAA